MININELCELTRYRKQNDNYNSDLDYFINAQRSSPTFWVIVVPRKWKGSTRVAVRVRGQWTWHFLNVHEHLHCVRGFQVVVTDISVKGL